jgi:hypothetical protein
MEIREAVVMSRQILYVKVLSLCFGLVIVAIGLAIFASLFASLTPFPQKVISYQTDRFDFYFPFSDIYIKEMVSSDNGSIVYFYPEGTAVFSFANDGTVRKEIGNHFVECTRSGNGTFITITNTDIPFMPKIDPAVWGTPVGDADDFSAMKDLFKTQREGQCDAQTDFMVKLAHDNNIIARRINLWQAPADGMLTAGGHTTMEIYDRKTKRWIWMDPLYNVVEGKTGTRPFTLQDFQISVNRGENITLTLTDGEEVRFGTWEYAETWKNYLNPSQAIAYVIPEA